MSSPFPERPAADAPAAGAREPESGALPAANAPATGAREPESGARPARRELSSRLELAAMLVPAAVLLLLVAATHRAAMVRTVASVWSVRAAEAQPAVPAPPGARMTALRVCSDPNNLPFSNERGEGFENAIAQLVARELGTHVEYTWWAQRRGFVRNTLRAGRCDVSIGAPSSMELVLPTRPYYRSTYVFVSRHDRHLGIRSLDDPRLERLRVGVQLVGDDYANAPPVEALLRRGARRNLVGFTVYGNYATPNPPARIVDAVARGAVDVAVVWGPLAGYFARRAAVPLDVTPVSPQVDVPFLPFVFDIAMGVRRGDTTLRARLDSVIVRRRPSIDSILRSYDVPRVDRPAARAGADGGRTP